MRKEWRGRSSTSAAPERGEDAGSKKGEGGWPQTWGSTLEREAVYWQREFGRRAKNGETSADVFKLCQDQLANDLGFLHLDEEVKKIVGGTHFVPRVESVKYGHSAKYDYLNYYMGYDAANAPDVHQYFRHPKVVQGLCGHTHRHKTLEVDGVRVDNVSGGLDDQACIIEV